MNLLYGQKENSIWLLAEDVKVDFDETPSNIFVFISFMHEGFRD
jgi:hypothetical protein